MADQPLTHTYASWRVAIEGMRRRSNGRRLRFACLNASLALVAITLVSLVLARWHGGLALMIAILGVMASLWLHWHWLRRQWLPAHAPPLWLDRQLGLKARLVTAHELAGEERQTPMLDLLVGQLASMWPERFPWRRKEGFRGLPDRRALILLISALLFILFFSWRPHLVSIGKGPAISPETSPPPLKVTQVPPQEQQDRSEESEPQGSGSEEASSHRDKSRGGSQEEAGRHQGQQVAKGSLPDEERKAQSSSQGKGRERDQGKAPERAGRQETDSLTVDEEHTKRGEEPSPTSAQEAPSGGEAQLKQEITQLLNDLETSLAKLEQPGPAEGQEGAQGQGPGPTEGSASEESAGQVRRPDVGDQPDPNLFGEQEQLKPPEEVEPFEIQVSAEPHKSATDKRPVRSTGPSPKGQLKVASPSVMADPHAKIEATQQETEPVESPYLPPEYQEILQRVTEEEKR